MISVIVPAYNAESTLAETLASVQAQTVRASEIVVVDDGSTDRTAEIANSFGVAVVGHAVNVGVSAAINTGLAVTSGAVVAIVDADDLWASRKLEIQSLLLEAADLVVGSVQEFVDPVEPSLTPRPVQTGWLYGACLIRRAAFDQLGVLTPSLRTGAWVDWMSRARAAAVRTTVHPDVVLHRRLRRGSLSSTDRTQDLVQIARAALHRKRHG